MKTRIVVAALITTVASTLAACNLDSNRDTRVTFELPLLDCTSLQDPLLGGSQMAGTFIAVAGAEFPPITELRRDTNPCANTQVDERKLAELAVSVPAGRKRALAIAIVGQPIALGDLLLPESIDGRGINIRTTEPRPVFFAGGKILEGDVLSQEAPQLALIMEPFVNMLGSVQRGGRGGRAAATIKFMMPDVDGCLTTVDCHFAIRSLAIAERWLPESSAGADSFAARYSTMQFRNGGRISPGENGGFRRRCQAVILKPTTT